MLLYASKSESLGSSSSTLRHAQLVGKQECPVGGHISHRRMSGQKVFATPASHTTAVFWRRHIDQLVIAGTYLAFYLATIS
jgi:hypothetical protein